MAYDLIGKIKLIQEAQTFTSGFTKREFVVTVEDGKFPQDINIEFLQDKVSLLDTVSIGQEVTVSFDVRGREYNGRYFNNLVGWKMQAGEASTTQQAQPEAPAQEGADVPADDDDLIPF